MPAQLAKGDDPIIRSVIEWGLLTPTEIQTLVGGRNIVSVRRRLLTLGFSPRKRGQWTTEGLGYLRYVDPPEERFGERIYYAAQPAYDLAFRHGWISQPIRAVERKRSNNKLVHDRLVVAYRFTLFQKFGERLHASSQHYNLFHRWGKAETDHIYADLFFYLDFGTSFPAFFVELENTAEHHYDERRGLSARVRKCEAYVNYLNSGAFETKFRYPDFRVILIIPTARQAENFAQKLHELGGELDSRKFWITDFEGALGDNAATYMTPRDFRTKRYSLPASRAAQVLAVSPADERPPRSRDLLQSARPQLSPRETALTESTVSESLEAALAQRSTT